MADKQIAVRVIDQRELHNAAWAAMQVLAGISLNEYESTSSAAEKVRANARRAREAAEMLGKALKSGALLSPLPEPRSGEHYSPAELKAYARAELARFGIRVRG